MVSLLPPQSDATLPGPARLEGEPQGDLMQAPGLPGSPAPQNVSTWCLAAGGPVTPTPSPRAPPGICLVSSSSEQVPSDSKIQKCSDAGLCLSLQTGAFSGQGCASI